MGVFQKSVGWVRRNLPKREQFERIRWLRPVAHRVLRPELWRFHRRSVPRGVALGWFIGVLVPIAQVAIAALLALPARANVPVAALTTFLTNPLTTPPLWYAGYRIGHWILQLDAQTDARAVQDTLDSSAGELLRWLVSDAAPATALGLLIIAVVGAAIGYVVAALGWRWWIAHKWRKDRRSH